MLFLGMAFQRAARRGFGLASLGEPARRSRAEGSGKGTLARRSFSCFSRELILSLRRDRGDEVVGVIPAEGGDDAGEAERGAALAEAEGVGEVLIVGFSEVERVDQRGAEAELDDGPRPAPAGGVMLPAFFLAAMMPAAISMATIAW